MFGDTILIIFISIATALLGEGELELHDQQRIDLIANVHSFQAWHGF